MIEHGRVVYRATDEGEFEMKYHSEIVGWGKEALCFLADKDMNFVILFNEGAPKELAEISILHTKAPLLTELAVGDTLMLCGKVFTITAIGDEARETFRELGHCTLSFQGGGEAERPGCIMLEGEPLVAEDIVRGGTIEIY